MKGVLGEQAVRLFFFSGGKGRFSERRERNVFGGGGVRGVTTSRE